MGHVLVQMPWPGGSRSPACVSGARGCAGCDGGGGTLQSITPPVTQVFDALSYLQRLLLSLHMGQTNSALWASS